MTQSESLYFSVIVPTKNRSHLVEDAISSVLSQSFDDFEVVVVDNDDMDSTAEVVSGIRDPRLKYFRTGGMSMVENWEFGRRKCSGRYLTVLEDKLTYYPWSLQKIYNLLQSAQTDIVVWGVGKENAKANSNVNTANFELQRSDSILQDYVNGKRVWDRLPRTINSCLSTSLVEEIRGNFPTGDFFNYSSPDLVAAFSQLALRDQVMVLKENLGFRRSSVSNAKTLRVTKESGIKYFAGSSDFRFDDVVAHVPIKNVCLVKNTIYNDFLNCREILGRNLAKHEMTGNAYVRVCLMDVCSTLLRGGEIKSELKDVGTYMRQQFSVGDRIKLWLWWLSIVCRGMLSKRIFKPLKRILK